MPVNNFLSFIEMAFLLTFPNDQLLDPILIQMFPVVTDESLCPFYICLVTVPLLVHNSSFPPRRNVTLEI